MSQTPPQVGRLIGCFNLDEDSRIIEVNATALRWLGYSREELVGRPFHGVLGGGGQFFLQSQILPMLKLKGSLEEVYLRMKETGGGTIPVLVNVARFETGTGAGIEVSFMRIPQRGHLEDELLQAKKLAEQANDSKTKFLGMMSHELRTPLQAIGLINQALLDGEYGELTTEQKEIVKSSEDSAASVTALIDDILNFARMEGGPVQIAAQTLAVNSALERAEVSIRHRFLQAGLTCTCRTVPEEVIARYDPNRLHQILINLLNNALKFTRRGGSVTLDARREAESVLIEVTDTGCGIPPDQLQRVFEPFVQLHTAVESTDKPGVGLGLAICRDLARAMGGGMGVRSTVGVGSTFSVSLPLGL